MIVNIFIFTFSILFIAIFFLYQDSGKLKSRERNLSSKNFFDVLKILFCLKELNDKKKICLRIRATSRITKEKMALF